MIKKKNKKEYQITNNFFSDKKKIYFILSINNDSFNINKNSLNFY